MKKFVAVWFILLLVITIVGCENQNRKDGQDKQAGIIIFYKEPTLENTEPSSSVTHDIMKEQKNKLTSIIKSVKKWTDDAVVDRLPFYFDGEFTFFGGETTYFFSYEYNVIYYDHYFAGISAEQMQYIKDLNING